LGAICVAAIVAVLSNGKIGGNAKLFLRQT